MPCSFQLVNDCQGRRRSGLTISWLRRVALAVKITTSLSSHAMRVETIFPFSHFSYFFIAPLIFLVVVRPRRIIDVVPVGDHFRTLSILLPLFAATALPLFCSIEAIHILVICGCSPVGEGRLSLGTNGCSGRIGHVAGS